MSTGNQASAIPHALDSISTDLVRVYDTRPTSNNHASGMVALFSGLLTFRCVVINDRAVLGKDVYVFFERRNVTRAFSKMLARRIASGSEGAPQGEPSFTPVLTVYDTRRLPGRNNTVGMGRLFISHAGFGISIPFWVKEPEDRAYRIVFPGYYIHPPYDPVKEKLNPKALEPKWIDKFRWQVGSHDISSDIRGAALKGWLYGLGLTGTPARLGHEWRRCATCRWHVFLDDEGLSTWEMRDSGEVAPRHFCAHPAYMRDGDPVPLAMEAVRFANEALAHYGRKARADSLIWITPHKKGIPARLQEQAIWEEGCNLHTFRGEADWSRITSAGERVVIEIPRIGTNKIHEIEVKFPKSPERRPRA
ncbi:MAG TPA: hypothetical protein GX506_03300 [Firmicutes bacterium]|nr:hypothetical protein [Bacillota bacterium]